MLTDESIRTLIAVMGTGVGETFDITKIRYNKIIIMTDADVDGSHILTLLITFFFRYMRQIIENGYLYVAQPPLYGVKQGQKMSYLLDDKALAEFLLERQLDKITFKNGEELIENDVVREFIKDLFSLASDIKSRGIIAEAFVMAKIGREDQDINDRLIESLNQLKIGKWIYEQREIDTVFVYETNGLIYRYTFNAEKLPVKYFNFIEKWQKFWSADMKMTYNDKLVNTINPMQIYQVFSQKSELHIQRYKGLGEMNPDDLAKTAMQSYLQVTYDNEQEADELIDKLMGDDVEPRKRFIEEMEPLLETDD